MAAIRRPTSPTSSPALSAATRRAASTSSCPGISTRTQAKLRLMPSAHDIALIRVQLDDAEPAIWRRFAAPVTTTLKGLHDLIQAAMGGQDYHLWEFEIGPHRYGDPDPEYQTNPPTQRAVGVKLAALIAR